MLRLIQRNRENLVIGVVASLAAAALWFVLQQAIQPVLGLKLGRTEGALLLVFASFVSFMLVALPLLVSKRPRMWIVREDVRPPFRNRVLAAKEDILLVGIALDTVVQNYLEEFVTALETQSNLRLRVLMLHPDSLHARAHQEFATYDLKSTVRGTIDGPLCTLYHRLSEKARRRLDIRLTHYLPRFSCRVVDSTMLINFYLLHRRAQSNPTIEFRRNKHSDEFDCMYSGLNELFAYDGSRSKAAAPHPNLRITEEGKWLGWPPNKRMEPTRGDS